MDRARKGRRDKSGQWKGALVISISLIALGVWMLTTHQKADTIPVLLMPLYRHTGDTGMAVVVIAGGVVAGLIALIHRKHAVRTAPPVAAPQESDQPPAPLGY